MKTGASLLVSSKEPIRSSNMYLFLISGKKSELQYKKKADRDKKNFFLQCYSGNLGYFSIFIY